MICSRFRMRGLYLPLILAVLGPTAASNTELEAAESPVAVFLQKHCYDCHEGDSAEAGLDLSTLGYELTKAADKARWIRIIDRVQAGEMPPADAEQPVAGERRDFLKAISEGVRKFEQSEVAKAGRVRARRLTRPEIERSLHDLLGIDVPLADKLPEDPRSSGFSTVADGQSMSHFQLEKHLSVVDEALDEAFRRALSPKDNYERDFDAAGVARRNPRRRCREPEMRKGRAVVWSGGVIFYGRLPATMAREDGWYRFTVTLSGLKLPKTGGVWTTVHTGLCVSSAPLLTYVTAFEATTEPKTIEFDAWLPKRHMLEIRPGDVTLRRARFAGGQIGTGEGESQNVPGIAIDRITMKRIHQGPDDDGVRRLLFGELKVRRRQRSGQGAAFEVVAESPRKDLATCMRVFARRAFRRDFSAETIAPYLALAQAEYDKTEDFIAGLRAGYRALLCSPRFLYLTEAPGILDNFAIASRLSYFLTGGPPDIRLSDLAKSGRLRNVDVIREEADRMLKGAGGRKFVEDFAAQWLDLDQIDFTQPDRKLFPRFDSIVKHAMLNETHTFLQTMLEEDQSVTRLVDADYTYLNSRLARFYDVEGVKGDQLRKVSLSADDQRGGLLTQGAILKVTANGSTTSPVVRGVWISERLLGVAIPPPPDNVPAIEPDIRGATTIREQLAKHRSQQSCAVCHVKIDPPGFAMENFDPVGRWRSRYVQMAGRRRKPGPKIDASYSFADGRKFKDGADFRRLVASNPHDLAANVVEKMLVYGTGAPISFADRNEVEEITHVAADKDYGFRSLLHAVVTSRLFLSK